MGNKPAYVYSIGSECSSERVFLYIEMEGISLVSLSDSGADLSLLTRSAFDRINGARESPLTVDPSQSASFKALGPGELLTSLGTVTVDVLIDEYLAINVLFHVVEDTVTSHEVILGADFLCKHYLAPSPAHRGLLYWPPDAQIPMLLGKPVSFRRPMTLGSPLILKPMSVNFVKLPKPEMSAHEALFEPDVELLEKQVAFSRCLVDTSSESITLEVLCLSPVEVRLNKHTTIGSLSQTEEFNFPDNDYVDSEGPASVADLFNIDTTQLTEEEQVQVSEMLIQNKDVIGHSTDDVGLIRTGSHTIGLVDPLHEPIKIPPRRLQGKAKADVQAEVSRLCEEGIIEPSESPWSAPVVPIYKPDGSVRLCIDYRALNKITLKDAYPIPNLEDTIYNLHDVRYFSSLDLMRGYYQVPMSPNSKPLTSFVTGSGQWQFCRMPFGLCNAPATFQRLMNTILSGFSIDRVMVYLDDVLVIGKTFEEHLDTLGQVLDCLKHHGLKVNPRKCQLFRDRVKFLGHIVSSDGLSPLPENIEAIVNYNAPRSIKSVQRFLGMINFYRRFIPNCSVIAKPISSLLSAKNLVWTDQCQEAFESLKSLLVSPPILGFPDFSSGEPLSLYTDASQYGAGAYLSQKQDGKERVIAYLSTTFNQAEIKYSVLDKELAAIRWAVRRLKPFLWGRHFVIYSDHKPLSYLQGMRLLDGRLARTLEELGDYDFEVRYIPGRLNVVADTLSRDSLSVPITLNITDDYLLANMHEFRVQSGADTLFRCFALYWLASEEEHCYIRALLIDEILNNPQRYNVTLNKANRRQLRLMRIPGTLPYFECIQAFSNIVKAPVFVYEDSFGLIKYVPDQVGERKPCYIRSYDSVCFSFLVPDSSISELEGMIATAKERVIENEVSELGEAKVLHPLAGNRVISDCPVPNLMTLEEIDRPPITLFSTRSSPSLSESQSNEVPNTRLRKKKKTVTFSPDSPEIHYFVPSNKPLRTLSCWRETFNLDTLLDWQKTNSQLKGLRDCITRRDHASNRRFKCRHLNRHRRYRSHYSSIHLDSSGLLVKELKPDHLQEPVFPYLVPFIAACDLVRLAHTGNAHVGREKLYHLIQAYVFHPSLRHIVADVTRSCDHCLRSKPYSSSKAPPVLRIQSNRPFEKVHVDVMQLPSSTFGYKYVLNAVDQYSKWLASQPLKDKSSTAVSTAFAKILTSFPTLPDTIISDNGGEFIGDPFKKVLDQYNIKHILITPYTPQANGLVERVNRTLMGILTGIDEPNAWYSSLSKAVITYNNTYHKELKCTPSECLIGIASRLPVRPTKKPFWKEGSKDFRPFAVNSLVGYKCLTRAGVSGKMTERYTGPYQVVTAHANNKTYVIQSKKDPNRQIRAQHNQLRPWFPAPAYMQRSSMFLPDLTDCDSKGLNEPATPEFVPGLKQLMSPKPEHESQVYEPSVPITTGLMPEVIPGLSNFKFPPNFSFNVPFKPSTVSEPISSTVPGSSPLTVSVPLQFPQSTSRSASSPIVSQAPLFSSTPCVSPVSQFPAGEVSMDSPGTSQGAIRSVYDLFPRESDDIGSIRADFLGFDMYSGNPQLPLGLRTPHTSRADLGPVIADSTSDSRSDRTGESPQSSMHSFREQSAQGQALHDPVVALDRLFRDVITPLDATFMTDSDLPSVGSNVSQYLTGSEESFDAVPLPRRLTRSVRTQVYPDLSAEEALRRIHFPEP